MLQRVRLRHSTYNNQQRVANSLARSTLKLVYYYCIAAVYGACGGCANVSCLVTMPASRCQQYASIGLACCCTGQVYTFLLGCNTSLSNKALPLNVLLSLIVHALPSAEDL